MSTSSPMIPMWMQQHAFDDKSTLVHVMAWCHETPSYYLHQCWPRSLSPSGIIGPQQSYTLSAVRFCEILWRLSDQRRWFIITNSQRNFAETMFNLEVSIVPVNGLAPCSARSSRGTVTTKVNILQSSLSNSFPTQKVFYFDSYSIWHQNFNSLLSDVPKPLPEPMLTYHQQGPTSFP